MKKFILSLSILLLLLATLPVLAACGGAESGSGNTVTDMFGHERSEYCFGTECLVLPTYPELSWLFGSKGESGIVSEAALAENGKLQNENSGYVVCVIYSSNLQDFSTTKFDLTYCSGTQILQNGAGIEIGNVSTLGTVDAELDMTLEPSERLKVTRNHESSVRIQGAIIIPIQFAEGAIGTVYVELSVKGDDMTNPQLETKQEAQVGVNNARVDVNVHEAKIGYLTQSAYQNGDYDEKDIQQAPSFDNGEACYMVLDLGYHALTENDGSGTLNVLAYMPQRGAMDVTIEEATTGRVDEVTSDNITTIYASFSVLPTNSTGKYVRMILRLLPVSNGTVKLDIYITGGEGTALTGHTHVSASLEI